MNILIVDCFHRVGRVGWMVYYCIMLKYTLLLTKYIYQNDDLKSSHPVDTGRNLNVHNTFRKRLQHLLKVLYTFNLRPVSTGQLDFNSIKLSIFSII